MNTNQSTENLSTNQSTEPAPALWSEKFDYTAPKVLTNANGQLETYSEYMNRAYKLRHGSDSDPILLPAPITARECESNIIRDKFAALGYSETAPNAIIEWRIGSRGIGYHVAVVLPMFNRMITLFYSEWEDRFEFSSLSPIPTEFYNGIAAPGAFDQIPYNFEHSRLWFAYSPMAQPIPAQSEPEHHSDPIRLPPAPGAVSELDHQLDYWVDRLHGALAGNDWEVIDLCNLWIAAIAGVLDVFDPIRLPAQ